MSVSLQRVWKSSAALALCEHTGYPNPVDAIEAKARDLVSQSGISRPPFSPFSMGFLKGIVQVKFKPIGFDACLIPVRGGFEVHICSLHTRGRQAFSMAHEIGHLFFIEVMGEPKTAYRDKNIGLNRIGDEEEYLCDIAASELIFPSPFFDTDLYERGPSLRSLLEIRALYSASLHATVLRFARKSLWKCTFLFWKLGRPDSKRKLEVDRCITQHSLTPSFKDEIFLRDESRVLGALGTKKIIRGREWLKLGGEEDRYYMETVQVGSPAQPRLLSIVVAEPHAEYLVDSRRKISTQRTLFPQIGQQAETQGT